ncbi:MAG: hypothetical protein JWL88_799 [Parcubacteria group bacterium]|nr:hypothetical protein [Parcubacteria group bacterium]
MRKNSLIISAASTIALAAFIAVGSASAAFADSGTATTTSGTATTTTGTATTTSGTASSTAPVYCTSATTTEGYYVFTDQPSYMPGQMINFCLLDNTRTPMFLEGTHPWTIADQNGNTVFTPDPGMFVASSSGTNFFVDDWNGMNASSTSMASGTYQVLFGGFPGAPSGAFMIMPASTTGTTTTSTSTGSTGTTTPGLNDLVGQLTLLEGQFPAYLTQLQAFIAQLMGTGSTTPPVTTGTGSVDQNGQTYSAGGSIDFVGRNFSRETNLTVSLNGQMVATAHADGGGNFSTGSIALPSTAGTYTYTFTGNGTSVPATIIVK